METTTSTNTTGMANREIWTLGAIVGAGGLTLVSLVGVILSIIIAVAVRKKKAKREPDYLMLHILSTCTNLKPSLFML